MNNNELKNSIDALKKLAEMVDVIAKKKVSEAVTELETLQKLLLAEKNKRNGGK